MNQAADLMHQAVRDGVFPGGVLLVSVEGKTLLRGAFGKANIFSGAEVTEHTVFDLSSLTKPLATAVGIMQCLQEGRLGLGQAVGDCLSYFENAPAGRITLRHLLNHTSGLPAYRPYYQTLVHEPPQERRGMLKRLVARESLMHPPGKTTVYSDLGFMILGWVLEDAVGERMDAFVERHVYSRIGIDRLFFIGLDRPDAHKTTPAQAFAATERCPWRDKVVEGEVHDDNAFIAGGIEGHAGLFGTADDVNRLLVEIMHAFHGRGGAGVFTPNLVRLFLKRPDHGGRALGFDVPASVGSSCGRFFSYNTVGHLGFTGTSFWMDLDRLTVVVLLTNRVHPSRDNEKIKQFRPIIHDRVMACLAG